MDKYFSIKETSKLTGLSSSNIRYYESEGLIKNICRNKNGVRYFSQKEIDWTIFLGRLKSMEVPITEMKLYADLREKGNGTIKERMHILEKHKEKLLEKINKLYENINLLDNKLEVYKQIEEDKNE